MPIPWWTTVTPTRSSLLVEIVPSPNWLSELRLPWTPPWTGSSARLICLPAYAELSLEIPVADETPEPDPAWTTHFQETRDRLPRAVEGWTARGGGDGVRIPSHDRFRIHRDVTSRIRSISSRPTAT